MKGTRAIQLKRIFLFREVLKDHDGHYSEKETQILIAIYLMGESCIRCSGYTLFKKISKVHRTSQKKGLLIIIKKFKSDGMVRSTGSKIELSLKGKLHLLELERLLGKVRFHN